MEPDREQLRREIDRLKLFATLTGLVLAVLVLGAFVHATSTEEDVLRARGLIIEDAGGRPRILLGAPIPDVENRVRTDTARVRETWAQRYPDPDEYMQNYRERIQHSMNGVLILNEEGFDRVAVGAPNPDPNIGPRLGPGTGLVINDERGNERSGYGLLEVDGRDRVVLGLDSRGREGVTLSLKEHGERGLSIYDGETTVFVGAAPSGHYKTASDRPFRGLVITRNDSVLERVGSVRPE